MATSKKIKSAIRSKGLSERQLMGNIADIRESLSEADYSSKMFDIKSKQSGQLYDAIYSGLNLATTIAGTLEQRSELKSNIETFKESLGEGSELTIQKKPSLIDVFKKESSLSDYLKGDQYLIGDKAIGSKYDVSALGSKIKSEQTAKDLLERMTGKDTMPSNNINLESPKVGSITGGASQLPPKFMQSEGGGLETPKSVFKPEMLVMSDEYMESQDMDIGEKRSPSNFLTEYTQTSNTLRSMLDPNYYENLQRP